MASETRPTSDSVDILAQIEAQPYAFEFFEAMRRIDCAFPAAPRLGTAARPADEPIRLGQEPSLEFAASMLARVERSASGRVRVLGYFLGLYGPQGPLPLHLTEYVHDRITNARDRTLAAFADIFHHRVLTLFYRAWANARPSTHFDRPDQDHFTKYIGATFGLGQRSLQNRDAMPDRAKLYYAGLLGSTVKTRAGLEEFLTDYLELPVRVEECVGEWLPIEKSERMRLGERRTSTLGMSLIGERVFSSQHKIRIVVGPVSGSQLLQYLPGGASLQRLRAAVLNYLGLEHAWDVQFVVRRSRVPALRLGAFGHLGWSGWLAPPAQGPDLDDVLIDADAAVQ